MFIVTEYAALRVKTMSLFILIETNPIFVKLIFFYDFMHFELRWYVDCAFNLLIQVWDSSSSGQ